jgi:hypothetical protein
MTELSEVANGVGVPGQDGLELVPGDVQLFFTVGVVEELGGHAGGDEIGLQFVHVAHHGASCLGGGSLLGGGGGFLGSGFRSLLDLG